MKRIIFLLLITTALYSDGFYSAGSFGYDWIYDTYKTEMAVGYEFKGLFIEAEQDTFMKKASKYMFRPLEQEYYARAGYRYKNVFVKWEHLCIHGIDDFYSYRRGHDRFTIGFDTRLYEKNNNP